MRKVLFLLFSVFSCAETGGFSDDTRDRLQFRELKKVEPLQWEVMEAEDAILNPIHSRGLESNVPAEINSMDSMDNRLLEKRYLRRNILGTISESDGSSTDRVDATSSSTFTNKSSSGNKNTTNPMVTKSPSEEPSTSVHEIATSTASRSTLSVETHNPSTMLSTTGSQPSRHTASTSLPSGATDSHQPDTSSTRTDVNTTPATTRIIPTETVQSPPGQANTTVGDVTTNIASASSPSEEAQDSPTTRNTTGSTLGKTYSTTTTGDTTSGITPSTASKNPSTDETPSSPTYGSPTITNITTSTPLMSSAPTETLSSTTEITSTHSRVSTAIVLTGSPTDQTHSPSGDGITVGSQTAATSNPTITSTVTSMTTSRTSINTTTVSTESASPPSGATDSSSTATGGTTSGVTPSTASTSASTDETPSSPTYSSPTITNVNTSTLLTSSPPTETLSSTAEISSTHSGGSTAIALTGSPTWQTHSPSGDGITVGSQTAATSNPTITSTVTSMTTSRTSSNTTTVSTESANPPSGATDSSSTATGGTTSGITPSTASASASTDETPSSPTYSSPTITSTPLTSSPPTETLSSTAEITSTHSGGSTAIVLTGSPTGQTHSPSGDGVTIGSQTASRTTTAKSTRRSTTSRTTTAKSTSRTTTTDLCYNGGTYDGIKCICNEDLFYGPKCEFPVDEIHVKQLSVTITVEAQVKVTNREFNKSLEDLSSNYSQEIQAQFRKQMKVIYEGSVPGYQTVEILEMRNGSVIVVHKVISQVPIENNLEMIPKQMEKITVAVNQSLKDIHADGDCGKLLDPELCFVPLPNSIINTTVLFSPEENCRNISDPRYADYYYPQITEGTLRCISRCVKGTQGSMNCFEGVCHISEIGPQCNCNNLDMFWYLDSYCQLRIQKSILGLGLALTVLFVISIILTVFFIKAKQKKSKKSWSVDADIWYGQDADEEWIPSGGLNIMNKAAVSSWDKHQDRNKTLNLSLDSVDTSVQVHFQKPVVTTDC